MNSIPSYKVIRVVILAIIAYFGIVMGVHAQRNSQIEDQIEKLRDREDGVATMAAQNQSKLGEIDHRMLSLENMQIEHRLTSLENTEATSFRLLVGIMAAVVLQLIDRLLGRSRVLWQRRAEEESPAGEE